MSIQVLPQMPTFGQALGQSLIRGMEKTLPKFAERGALSAGLKTLAKEAGGLTPLELLARAEQIAGMTDQKLSAMMPFLQSARAEAAAKREMGIPPSTETAGSDDSSIPEEKEVFPLKEMPTKTQLINRDLPYFGVEVPYEILRQRAAKNRAKTGRTFEEQLAIENQEAAKTTAIQQKFIESEGALPQLISNEIGRITEAAGFKDIPGVLQENMIAKGRKLLERNPADPAAVAQEIGKDVDNFMKVRSRIASGRESFKTLVNPSSQISALNQAKKIYSKDGNEELFRDDLENFKGLSKGYASLFVFPPSEGVKKALDSGSTGDSLYKRIADAWTSEDNPVGIATAIERSRKRNTSANGFLKYISDRSEKGEIDLTDFQERELVKREKNYQPSISDIIYFTLIGRKI